MKIGYMRKISMKNSVAIGSASQVWIKNVGLQEKLIIDTVLELKFYLMKVMNA
jgi:hypothetical protein